MSSVRGKRSTRRARQSKRTCCRPRRANELFRAWMTRYPQESEPYFGYLDALIAQGNFDEGRNLLLEISEAFNGDEALVFQARAKLADAEQGPEAALELLEQSFRADWDPALVRTYFQALESADRLRARQEEARTALRQNPRDLRATAWLFDYAQRQGDRAAAVAALDEFRRAHGPSDWTGENLRILAGLYRQAGQFQDAAKSVYAL
ncbi:MAG: tetratricopeptide repeat protein [Bryobacterales bacterium]